MTGNIGKSGWKKGKLVWADMSQRMLVLTRWKPRPDVGPNAAERISDANTYDVTDEYWRAVDAEIRNVQKALAEAAKKQIVKPMRGDEVARWVLDQELKRVE
jgi:hypothetical protein